MDKNKLLSLYVHIPFCIKKCNYCDFLSFPCISEEKKDNAKCDCCYIENDRMVDINDYINSLCSEIDCMAAKYKEYSIYSIFIGGGTPSLLSVDQISKIFDSLHKFNIDLCYSSNVDKSSDEKIAGLHNETKCLENEQGGNGYPEITIEANPGTITKEKAAAWKKLGINRVSIGLQSADNGELAMLGRIHTWEDFLKSWEIITQAGFTNRNIDLISGLPGQKIDTFKKTLEKVLTLKPEHISAYSLQLEEGTKFYDRYTVDDLPTEDEDRQMYELTRQLLKAAGYDRYEISNYSKPGFESKHNLVYWQRGNYLGLGLGAASMIENMRFSNISELERYGHIECKLDENADVSEIREDYQKLSVREQMEEFMFLGLRVMKGISEGEFLLQFKLQLQDVYGGILEKYIASGHMKYNNGFYSLTEKGIDVSNVILADFLMDL